MKNNKKALAIYFSISYLQVFISLCILEPHMSASTIVKVLLSPVVLWIIVEIAMKWFKFSDKWLAKGLFE